MATPYPLQMAECFIRDIRLGYWDKFTRTHIRGICDTLLDNLDKDSVEPRQTQAIIDIANILVTLDSTPNDSG